MNEAQKPTHSGLDVWEFRFSIFGPLQVPNWIMGLTSICIAQPGEVSFSIQYIHISVPSQHPHPLGVTQSGVKWEIKKKFTERYIYHLESFVYFWRSSGGIRWSINQPNRPLPIFLLRRMRVINWTSGGHEWSRRNVDLRVKWFSRCQMNEWVLLVLVPFFFSAHEIKYGIW